MYRLVNLVSTRENAKLANFAFLVRRKTDFEDSGLRYVFIDISATIGAHCRKLGGAEIQGVMTFREFTFFSI